MAIPFALIWPILLSVGKHILEIPLIHRGIENWVSTNDITLWDRVLWAAIESALNINDPPEERSKKIVEVTDRLQDAYDEVKVLKQNGVEVTKETVKAAVVSRNLPWQDDVLGEG